MTTSMHISDASFPAVIRLLLWRCPSAIVRRVWSIIVDSIDRVAWTGTWSHVFKECLKVCAPTFANEYSAGAVVLIVDSVPIVAAILHSLPRVIFDRAALMVGSICERGSQSLQASARRYLLAEVILSHDRGVPAFAATPPITVFALLPVISNDREHADLAAGKHHTSTEFHSINANLWGV